MGIHRNEFAANLNLKEHQFFFTHPVYGVYKTGNRTLEWPSTLNIYCMEIILQQLETTGV